MLPNYHMFEDLLKLHNDFRASHHKAPLELDLELEKIADDRARHIAAEGKLDHSGWFGDYSQHGYHCLGAAENILYGCTTAEAAYQCWANDPPHAANMLGDFNRVGFGIALSHNGTPFMVANFAKV